MITGAGGGIGDGIALTGTKAGAHVLLVGRDRDLLDPVDTYTRSEVGKDTLVVFYLINSTATSARIQGCFLPSISSGSLTPDIILGENDRNTAVFMSRQRRTFAPEFKREAVSLMLDQGYNQIEAGLWINQL